MRTRVFAEQAKEEARTLDGSGKTFRNSPTPCTHALLNSTTKGRPLLNEQSYGLGKTYAGETHTAAKHTHTNYAHTTRVESLDDSDDD